MKKEKITITENFTKLADNAFIDLDLPSVKKNGNVLFPSDVKKNANVLLIGSNLYGMFGYFDFEMHNGIKTNTVSLDLFRTNPKILYANLQFLINILKNKGTIYVVANNQILKEYFDMLFNFLKAQKICSKKQVKYISGIYNDEDYWDYDYTDENGQKHTHPGKMNKLKGMKFDYIIQNPPYSGSLHLTFFEKSLELLKDDGEMTIIEPATWLINVRKNGKAKIYDNIKTLVKGHVKSIKIENLNNEFQTNCFVPFSITKINMAKEYSEIEYTCCGANTVVNDLNECNLIGSYDLIWSILKKVQKYGDMMKNHCTSNDVENSWYCKYPYLMPSTFTPHGIGAISDKEYVNDNNFIGKYNLLFSYYYYSLICKDITSHIPFKKGPCGKITEEKVKSCLYGTKSELVNFNYYINENKLPLFINIVMTIDQHNNSLPYIPWLVDKIYTDDEINKLFDFTEDEINLIDKTIKKFERHSLWFKRYMCGPSSVSDEDVQKDLKEKGIC